MERRLVLVLHLDAFELVQGGGWSEHDTDGNQTAGAAIPAWPDGDLLPGVAAMRLLTDWTDHRFRQLKLPTL